MVRNERNDFQVVHGLARTIQPFTVPTTIESESSSAPLIDTCTIVQLYIYIPKYLIVVYARYFANAFVVAVRINAIQALTLQLRH